jgi:hypothetical protein
MSQAIYHAGFSWVDDDGNPIKGNDIQVVANYTIASVGSVPIPNGTVAGVEFDMPLAGMPGGGALIWIRNKTGQELNMAWGGNWFPHLAVDGTLIWAAPSPPLAGAITSLRFMTTAVQVGLGKITFALFGQ